MKPVLMQVKNDPPRSYGDCQRACIASILELPAWAVPHFVEDGDPNDEMLGRVRGWLADRGIVYATMAFEGSPLEAMGICAPDTYYILGGASPIGNHAVVAINDEIVHDPAGRPPGKQIVGPLSNGHYEVDIIGHPKALKVWERFREGESDDSQDGE